MVGAHSRAPHRYQVKEFPHVMIRFRPLDGQQMVGVKHVSPTICNSNTPSGALERPVCHPLSPFLPSILPVFATIRLNSLNLIRMGRTAVRPCIEGFMAFPGNKLFHTMMTTFCRDSVLAVLDAFRGFHNLKAFCLGALFFWNSLRAASIF